MTNSDTRVSARDKLIIALDVPDLLEAEILINDLRDYASMFKVGLELFTREGIGLFELFDNTGVSIFFDGKFHDIPNTVARASQAIAYQGVDMFNVHALGGRQMMEAAVEASRAICMESELTPPKVLAVTILTSIDEHVLNKELGINEDMDTTVLRLAKMAKECGLDGVVASAQEAPKLREALGPDFLLVTPGVRPDWAETNDQARAVTPYQAITSGADYLVIGRPITGANSRRDAAQRVLDEMEAGMSAYKRNR
jgi:orotidine-5'-phosphate decarboxylase